MSRGKKKKGRKGTFEEGNKKGKHIVESGKVERAGGEEKEKGSGEALRKEFGKGKKRGEQHQRKEKGSVSLVIKGEKGGRRSSLRGDREKICLAFLRRSKVCRRSLPGKGGEEKYESRAKRTKYLTNREKERKYFLQRSSGGGLSHQKRERGGGWEGEAKEGVFMPD